MNIKIELISEPDLADESFNIVIDGLKPREIYRVEMFLSDYYCINAPMLLAHDILWKSTATFVSVKNGIIDIIHFIHGVFYNIRNIQIFYLSV